MFHRHISDGSFQIAREVKRKLLPGIFDPAASSASAPPIPLSAPASAAAAKASSNATADLELRVQNALGTALSLGMKQIIKHERALDEKKNHYLVLTCAKQKIKAAANA